MMAPQTEQFIACQLCDRVVPRRLITLHHLLPKQKGGKAEHRVPMCKPCHKQIHATWGNVQLAKEFQTIESLRSAELLQPFLQWIRRQRPDRNFAVATATTHPGSKRQRLCNRRR